MENKNAQKQSNKRTVPVRFHNMVHHCGHLVAVDEKGFLWRMKGSIEDAVWEKVRHPTIEIDVRPEPTRVPGDRVPLTQKLPIPNIKV